MFRRRELLNNYVSSSFLEPQDGEMDGMVAESLRAFVGLTWRMLLALVFLGQLYIVVL